MFESGKHVKTLSLTCNRLCHKLAAQTGRRYAMATKALQVVHVVRHAAKVRSAVHADVNKTAPHILNGRVGQRWKHLQHALAHGLFEPGRGHGGVAHPAAKQQAVVCAEAVIVQDEIVVAHGSMAWNEPGTQGGVQRLCRHHVGTHRHDPGGDLGGKLGAKFGQTIVARQQSKLGAHGTCCGFGGQQGATLQGRDG